MVFLIKRCVQSTNVLW